MLFEKMNAIDFNKIDNRELLPSTTTGKLRTDLLCSDNANKNGSNRNSIPNSSSTVDDMNNMFTKFAFPFKLHSILENAEKSNQEEIISWLPSGKAFKIHKPKAFAEAIMPSYFQQTKYRSFQRQLYIYGFDRVKDKTLNDYGAYYHKLFVRGESDLCLDMTRQKIKGTGLSNKERQKKAALSNNANNKNKDSTTKKQKKQSSAPPKSTLSSFQNRKQSSSSSTSSKEKSLFGTTIPSSFMSNLSLLHPSLDLQSSSSTNNGTTTIIPPSTIPSSTFMSSKSASSMMMNSSSSLDLLQSLSNTEPKLLQLPRRVSERNNNNEVVDLLHNNNANLLHSSSVIKPFFPQQLQQEPQQQHQQQTMTRRVSEWNNDDDVVTTVAPDQQHSCNGDERGGGEKTRIANNNNNNGNNRRRCSLGFLRDVGRRGSLQLHDGDEVCFNDKKFFFTNQY